MYLIDLFANIFKKKNFGVLIWLIINTVLVTVCFSAIIDVIADGSLDEWLVVLLGFVTYIVTMAVSLSPVGEAILRLQSGCKKIKDKEIHDRLERIFNEVRAKSAEIDGGLNRKIRFYLSEDEDPNAFATGRKTVCVTRGLLDFTDDEIKGVLAHEFGHLSHKDTDVILVIAVGNLFVSLAVSGVSLFFRGITWFIGLIISCFSDGDGSIIGAITSGINFIISAIFGALLWLWTKLGVLICMSSSRQNEFHADKFAFEVGYGKELRDSLLKLNGGSKNKNKISLWASLNASHPDTGARIEKLESYMIEKNNLPERNSFGAAEFVNVSAEGLRGFNFGVSEEDYFKTVYIPNEINLQEEGTVKFNSPVNSQPQFQAPVQAQAPVQIQPQYQPPYQAQSPYGSQPQTFNRPAVDSVNTKPMNFHKFYKFLLIPLTILSSIINIITYGISITNYGFNVLSLVIVVFSFAQIVVSISTLIDFKNKNSSGFPCITASRIMAFFTTATALPELYNNFLYEGFNRGFAAYVCIIPVIVGVAINAAIVLYYAKRRHILFDNSKNN